MEMQDNKEMSPHLSFDCDGKPWNGIGQSTSLNWLVHFLAGITLMIWALHWNLGIFKSWLTQSKQTPFVSRNTYPVLFLPANWPVESLLKCILPPVAILTQLWWYDGSWTPNICPDGTVREGHFYPTHISAWANTWVLLAFMMSGLIDMLGRLVELPMHTEHFFTATAFLLQAFILNTSVHLDMLEDLVYYLLFLCAMAVAIFMIAEMPLVSSFFTSCGRTYALYLLAIWHFAATRFLYEGRTAWNTSDPLPDMAPAMFVVAPFAFWMNATSFSMLVIYMLMQKFYGYNEALETRCNTVGALGSHVREETIPLSSAPSDRLEDMHGEKGAELVPLVGANG